MQQPITQTPSEAVLCKAFTKSLGLVNKFGMEMGVDETGNEERLVCQKLQHNFQE